MAERKYYIFSEVIVFAFLTFVILDSNFACLNADQDKTANFFTLSPADRPLCIKLSYSLKRKKTYLSYKKGWNVKQVSISELKKKLAKEAIYKGKQMAEDRNWWYLSLPLGTITKALDGAEAFRRYLSRKFAAETKVEVSEKEIGFCIRKKF